MTRTLMATTALITASLLATAPQASEQRANMTFFEAADAEISTWWNTVRASFESSDRYDDEDDAYERYEEDADEDYDDYDDRDDDDDHDDDDDDDDYDDD